MKSVIVTGAANGIGAAIARHADSLGYRVGVLDIDGEAATKTAASLSDGIAITAANNDEDAIAAAFDAFGDPPEALVNNAGIVRFGPLIGMSSADWRSVVDVNLTGSFLMSREYAQRLTAAGRRGSIVSLTSINGVAPGPNAGAYAATKAGLAMLTQQMSVEWGPLGIRANSVAPGMIDGGMSAPIFADPEFRRLREAKVPARRLGTEDDIAKAVMWLCSDDADYITGHNLVVDGGVVNSIIGNLPRPETVDSVGAPDDE